LNLMVENQSQVQPDSELNTRVNSGRALLEDQNGKP
jgi:hypothetical protein